MSCHWVLSVPPENIRKPEYYHKWGSDADDFQWIFRNLSEKFLCRTHTDDCFPYQIQICFIYSTRWTQDVNLTCIRRSKDFLDVLCTLKLRPVSKKQGSLVIFMRRFGETVTKNALKVWRNEESLISFKKSFEYKIFWFKVSRDLMFIR